MLNLFKNLFVNFTVPVEFKPIQLIETAVEYELSFNFFNIIKAGGYCINREAVCDFIDHALVQVMDAKLEESITLEIKNELLKFDIFVQNLNPNILAICVYESGTISAQRTNLPYQAVKDSLVNHERFHAITSRKEIEWYSNADYLLIRDYQKVWYDFGDKLALMANHSALLASQGLQWLAVTEGLARIAAVLHAPKKYREYVAKSQFPDDPALLVKISIMLEKQYKTIENFMICVDAESRTIVPPAK